MADDQQKPRKRRRRRKRGRGGRGQKGTTPPHMATGAPVPADPYDEAAHIQSIKQQRAQQEITAENAEQILDDLLPMLLALRDFEILNWMVSASGQSRVAIVKQILRTAIVRERVNYREAKGEGGATSKNLQGLIGRM